MQVLEMEEVESLVGISSRKRLGGMNGSSKKRKSGKFDLVLSYARQCDLLPKLVVFACLLLLGLLYLSAQDEGTIHDPNEVKPFPSDTVPSAEVPMPSPVEVPSNQIDATPTQPNPTEKPVASPTQPPVDPPTAPEVVEENSPDDDSNNAFLYSKYATILPLVDHPLPNEEEKEKLAEKFGKWHFWDGDEEERPMEDYMSKYPNRDMPGEEIDDYAWQADAVYVNHILNDADQLIARTMEAIFIEYGHGKPLPPEGTSCVNYVHVSITIC
jgi:hypothetical protein